MKMIWQLFDTQIIIMSIVLLLFTMWLVWPRKHKKTRKVLIGFSGPF